MGRYTGVALDNVIINSGKVTGLQRSAPVTKTAAYTVGAADDFIIMNGAGSLALTLPAPARNVGRSIVVKTIAAQTVTSASSNVVPRNSATAGTAILAATAGAWAELVSDGTNWVIMAGG
jgi:hypothetical protein